MIPPKRMMRLLSLAEAARRDQSLLANHRGTVDRQLSQERAEIADLLAAIKDDKSEAEFISQLSSELAAIDHALTAYAH